MYYKEARGAFVVFDIARQKSFEAVLRWKEDIDAKVRSPSGGPLPTILLANKVCVVKEMEMWRRKRWKQKKEKVETEKEMINLSYFFLFSYLLFTV
jgi:hypothetical protein